ncbi:unnamed protein product, partial [Brassica oleracea]
GLWVQSVVSGLNRGFVASVDDLQRAETQRLFFASSTNFVYALHLSSFQARKIEAQLDEQMHLYHRLVSTKSDGEESDLEAGIDLLLRQLQQVNAQMQAWVS